MILLGLGACAPGPADEPIVVGLPPAPSPQLEPVQLALPPPPPDPMEEVTERCRRIMRVRGQLDRDQAESFCGCYIENLVGPDAAGDGRTLPSDDMIEARMEQQCPDMVRYLAAFRPPGGRR